MAKQKSPRIPANLQPHAEERAFTLDVNLGAMVELKAIAPENAYTAETLGQERHGHGIVINPHGLILTIGYLVIEAETVWLTTLKGKVAQGQVLAFDPGTGLGIVQALDDLETPTARLGLAANARTGDRLLLAGYGGASNAVITRLVAKQEFAGYWEYLLEEALFVSPAHPFWGGAGLFDEQGALIGVGSLQLEQSEGREKTFLNMFAPVDGLPAILEALIRRGRADGPTRPWIGLYALEVDERIVIVGVAEEGPADQAGLEMGDVILTLDGARVKSLGDLWRKIWALGPAGVEARVSVERNGRIFEKTIATADRLQFFRAPRLH